MTLVYSKLDGGREDGILRAGHTLQVPDLSRL